MNYNTSLTFVVLAYNHSGSILEHLESIAFLINKYHQAGNVDLVISDDASKDSTVAEARLWLSHNRDLFRNVAEYYGMANVGTCQSFLRATENIKTTHVKVTGGDDVYSDENIFEVVRASAGAKIIGSLPLVLIDGVLYRFHKFNLIHAVANAVYEGRRFRENLVGLGCIYTPGLIYSSDLICDQRVRDFVATCHLVEDFSSWVAISEYYPDVVYRLSKARLVYYRRTAGSAYLIAGGRVFADHLYCRKRLLDTETRKFNRVLIRNRIWLMINGRPWVRAFGDCGRYVLMARFAARLYTALNGIKSLFTDLSNHTRHYLKIRERSMSYIDREHGG